MPGASDKLHLQIKEGEKTIKHNSEANGLLALSVSVYEMLMRKTDNNLDSNPTTYDQYQRFSNHQTLCTVTKNHCDALLENYSCGAPL